MFDLHQFLRARQVRVMCDAVLDESGGDDVEAAIDSVSHEVSDLARALGADQTMADLVGRYWTLEMFYGWDADGVDPVSGAPRYADEPSLAVSCDVQLASYREDMASV